MVKTAKTSRRATKNAKNNSKTSKKGFRKADIADVEEAIEDARLVNKLKRDPDDQKKKKKAGADGEAEEEDDGLFTVDTAGSGEGLAKKTRRQLAREALFPTKPVKLGLSASECMKVDRAADRLEAQKQQKQQPASKGKEPFDLWSMPVQTPHEYALGSNRSAKGQEFLAIRRRKYVSNKAPGTLHQKVGLAPAVLPAHEGQSMNPDASAYEDLACTAAARFVEDERQADELDRQMKPMSFALRDALGEDEVKGLDDAAKIEALRSVLVKTSKEKEEDEEMGISRRGRVKSAAYRRKAKQAKIENEQMSWAQKEKKLEKQVGEVGAILKEMKQEAEIEEQRKTYRTNHEKAKRTLEETQGIVPKRRKLGRAAFKEEALVIPDAEAAAKGMRATPLKGSAIKDRLSSIMRRGLLPAQGQAEKSDIIRMGSKNAKITRGKRFLSPLLRDHLKNR